MYGELDLDGSSNRNPPERCPHPLYSQVSTQEDLTIPHHHQSGNLEDYNIVVKEEYKEENEEYGVIEEFSEEYKHVMMVAPHNRRCSHPLNSWNSTKGEDVMEIKVEGEVEETYVRDDQQYTEEEEEAGMMRTSIEEHTPTEISTGHAMEKPSKDHLTLSPGYIRNVT
ncbi:uncharacterized protein ACMZJ9_021769 [Mantella aurantiaca]